jgi:EF-hand domain pair
MKLNRIVVTALTLGAVGLGAANIAGAGDTNNPLDPSYKNALEKMRTAYFDMLKKMDTNMDGRISELEFVMNHDPLSPEYKKRSAEFKEMLRMMDANKDGEICLEEYMADANPLHPGHKFSKK